VPTRQRLAGLMSPQNRAESMSDYSPYGNQVSVEDFIDGIPHPEMSYSVKWIDRMKGTRLLLHRRL